MNSGRAGEIRQETVEAIRVRLRKLCEIQVKREVTLQNTVGLLSREIKRLLRRGFTMKGIAEQFNRGGIPLAAGRYGPIDCGTHRSAAALLYEGDKVRIEARRRRSQCAAKSALKYLVRSNTPWPGSK